MNITADHKRLLTDGRYFARTARKVAGARKGEVTGLIFLHEADDSCCLDERYQKTLVRLLEARPSDLGPVQADMGDWIRS